MTILIQIEFFLSTDQDFIFISIYFEAYAHLIDKNSHNLITLKFVKLLSKCEHSECSHSVINFRENVSISFNIKIHQNAESD